MPINCAPQSSDEDRWRQVAPRIGIGTAQFGSDYGVSNRRGRPDGPQVANILRRALEMGIGYIDTAIGYGEAEIIIGRHLPVSHRFRIVTKTPLLHENAIGLRHKHSLVKAIETSLERLRTDHIYALLLHRASDLAKPGWEHLVEGLHEIRSRGLATRIGASIYDDAQLALVESRFRPEVVQLPLNILDRRLMHSGTFERLKAQGTEIHARSVFLQGLLLMRPADMPEFFGPLRAQLARVNERWMGERVKPVAGCLEFVLQQAVDAAIIGVNHREELEEIQDTLKTSGHVSDVGVLTNVDPIYLDPSRWPAFDR